MIPVILFLQIKNQIQIFHWQTKSYAKHQALGMAYAALDPLTDRIIEILITEHGDFELNGQTIGLEDYNKTDMINLINQYVQVISNNVKQQYTNKSDIQNLLDEYTAELKQLIYRLTLI